VSIMTIYTTQNTKKKKEKKEKERKGKERKKKNEKSEATHSRISFLVKEENNSITLLRNLRLSSEIKVMSVSQSVKWNEIK
jgi:hypothetical protein